MAGDGGLGAGVEDELDVLVQLGEVRNQLASDPPPAGAILRGRARVETYD